MANGSDENNRRKRTRKPGSVEDWLAQKLAMLDGADDDDRSDPGRREPADTGAATDATADLDEDAPTVRARAVDPPPRPTRLKPVAEAPRARTIPPTRPGAAPDGPAPDPVLAGDLPDFEAEPLATEDVEPLLTEEVEPIEAPSDTDEVPKGARAGTPGWHAPDEAMWDLLGETTGSTAAVAVGTPAFPAGRSGPGLGAQFGTDEVPPAKPASRASQAATIPPASIKVGARPTPVAALDAEPPIRRGGDDENPDVTVSSRRDDGPDAVDALIAEASASPRPRRRRTAFSRSEGEAEGGLVAGDTLTPDDTEPPSPPSGFDEVFPISRGIPPVRARTPGMSSGGPTPGLSSGGPGFSSGGPGVSSGGPGVSSGGPRLEPALGNGADGAEEPTSALLATDVGEARPAEDAEPGTEWVPPEPAPALQPRPAPRDEAEEDDRTQIRPPSLAETLPRPPRADGGGAGPSVRPLFVQPPPDADESVDDDATQQRPVVGEGDAPTVQRRFHAPARDDEAELAGTLPPEVSSAVITWGSVIVGVLMFFVTMVLFAMFVLYLV